MGNDFFVLHQFPVIKTAVSKLVSNTGVRRQIGRRLRETVAAKVLRCAHHRHLHVGGDAYRDHSLPHFRPQPHACIEALGDDVNEPTLVY